MFIPSIFLLILIFPSFEGAPIIKRQVPPPEPPKVPSLYDLSSELIFNSCPAYYRPILGNFAAIGVTSLILYSCIGKGNDCIQNQFAIASEDNIFVNFLKKTIKDELTIGEFLLKNDVYKLLSVWKDSEDLDMDVKLILSLFLIKLEGDKNPRRRIHFHVCFKIEMLDRSDLIYKTAPTLESLSKLYFIEQNEQKFLNELTVRVNRENFCLTYNEFTGFHFGLQPGSEHKHISSKFESILKRLCNFQQGHYSILGALYHRAIQALLFDSGSLFKFVAWELPRYLQLLKPDIQDMIIFSQPIWDDHVAEIFIRSFYDDGRTNPSPFTQSGSGYLLSKGSLKTLFDCYYTDPKLLTATPFQTAFKKFQTDPTKPLLSKRGSLRPIFIISFDRPGDRLGLYYERKVPLFNFHFCQHDNSEEVTFSLQNTHFLKPDGYLGIRGIIEGNFLFITDREITENESDLVVRLHKSVSEGSPYMYYDLFHERFSVLEIVDYDCFINYNK